MSSRKFWRREDGAMLTEVGLMAVTFALVLVITVAYLNRSDQAAYIDVDGAPAESVQ